MRRTILATGGAGYIGSHVVVELIDAGYNVMVLDNFENSDPSVLDRIHDITGARIDWFRADVRDRKTLAQILSSHGVDAVIHLAGKKSLSESVANPLLYFNENLNGAIALLTAMSDTGVSKLVFSSSATVYGVPKQLPINETAPTGVTNPYGRTKLMIEEIISDVANVHEDFAAISLRYFNPVGAHESGLIGEDPNGAPNNLFPYVAQTAAGLRDAVQVFGDDYATSDGTGLRDYIHVRDLARGHVAALEHIFRVDEKATSRHLKINLGTGRGHTVLEVIRAFSQVCGAPVRYDITARRPGDVGASIADPSLANHLLGWKAEYGLSKMCRDHWHFQTSAGRRASRRNLASRVKTEDTGAREQRL